MLSFVRLVSAVFAMTAVDSAEVLQENFGKPCVGIWSARIGGVTCKLEKA